MKIQSNWLCAKLVLTFLASVKAIGFHGLHFKGLEEPIWIGTRTLEDKWIEQPLDHFNHRDNRTWHMRYFEEDKYFNGIGPIFILLGGEWKIEPGFLQRGLMHDIAKQHRALMFYTEHRYYGNSKPTENMSSDNMQYLNVDQALADIAYFVDNIKYHKNLKDSKVIVFGGSYAGNMAAWIRIKYPHYIQGAVASSAPVYAKADFYEYYEVVATALERHDARCLSAVRAAFDQVVQLLNSYYGPDKLQAIFNLCEKPNVQSRSDIGLFMNLLTEVFAGNVQYNRIVNGISNIQKLCNKMVNGYYREPIERLAELINRNQNCISSNYSTFIYYMKEVSWNNLYESARQWIFQTCTEYGYFQTTNSRKSIFGNSINLDYFINMCSDIYGSYYKRNLVDHGIRRTNIVYGGSIPDVSNVLFVNGDVDPWHALSVLKDINEASPAILIRGASHCQDILPDQPGDGSELLEARKRIKEIVSKWIHE